MKNNSLPEISLRDIGVTYPNGQIALEDISFDLQPGKIYGLIGVNGSGKSTLFKTIMGFLRPSKGDVRINGVNIGKALRDNAVAYVPQSEEVDWNFPILVKDVAMMGRYPHMGFLRIVSKDDKQKSEDALRRVGMTGFGHRQIGELSGGQKKRVFLARALAQEAKIILLDEPFAGVDIQTESAIIDVLRELRKSGHLILISTHNLNHVPELCDEVLLLNRSLVAAGPVETAFTEENRAKIFGIAPLRNVMGD